MQIGARRGRGSEGSFASDKEEREAADDRNDIDRIPFVELFAQQPGSEQKDVEGRSGLQEDCVGGGSESIGQDEGEQRRGISGADRNHLPGPAAARFGDQSEQQKSV